MASAACIQVAVLDGEAMSEETDAKTTGIAGLTTFLAEHKRRPTAKRDGFAAWLKDEIEYLEPIALTPYGEGSLSAYKRALKELETVDV